MRRLAGTGSPDKPCDQPRGCRNVDARRIEYLPLDDIVGAARNPKRHTTDGLIASIGRFGYATPALRDERTGRLVVGHGRTEAVRQIRDAGEDPPSGVRVDDAGLWLVPVVCGWASRSDAEAEAYLVADNRHTELGGWDHQELAELLADVQAFDPDLIQATGWDLDNLADLMTDRSGNDVAAPGEFPSYDETISTEHECPSCGYKWSGGKGGS
jgi:hypothetical protein